MLQMLPPAPSPQSAKTPPPVPAPAFDLGPAVDDDLNRLAADLDAILARRPAHGLRIVATPPPDAAAPLRPLPDEADEGEFEWLAAATAGSEAASAPGSAIKAAGWLHKAKRQRLGNRLRSVMSWSITVLLGSAVVGASSYMVLGRLPSAGDVLQLGQRLGL